MDKNNFTLIDTNPKWIWSQSSQVHIILEGLSGASYTIRNKVLDLGRMPKQNDNHSIATLLQILLDRNDCIYYSAIYATYFVY